MPSGQLSQIGHANTYKPLQRSISMMKGFSVESHKTDFMKSIGVSRKPMEDHYILNEHEEIIVVADGVTRDPKPYWHPLANLCESHFPDEKVISTILSNLDSPVLSGEYKKNPEAMEAVKSLFTSIQKLKSLDAKLVRTAFQTIEFGDWGYKYDGDPHALEAAKAFSKGFHSEVLRYGDNLRNNDLKEQHIRHAANCGNEAVREYGESVDITPKTTDWLHRDLAACVASGAVMQGDNVVWFHLPDCGLAIYSKDGIKVKTDNEINDENPLDIADKGHHHIDEKMKFLEQWEPRRRYIINKEVRNRPHADMPYGTFTGEQTAMAFVNTGTWKMEKGDILALHSDGLEDALVSAEGIRQIQSMNLPEIERYCKDNVRNEGTLVLYQR